MYRIVTYTLSLHMLYVDDSSTKPGGRRPETRASSHIKSRRLIKTTQAATNMHAPTDRASKWIDQNPTEFLWYSGTAVSTLDTMGKTRQKVSERPQGVNTVNWAGVTDIHTTLPSTTEHTSSSSPCWTFFKAHHTLGHIQVLTRVKRLKPSKHLFWLTTV